MYQLLGNQVRDSKEMGKMIMERTPFAVQEDLCHASKREDVLAWRLGLSLEHLQAEEPGEQEAMNRLEEEETINRLMEKTDALAKKEITPLLQPGDEMLSYAYAYDEGQQRMLLVLAIMDEDNAQRKLRDIVKRLLRT